MFKLSLVTILFIGLFAGASFGQKSVDEPLSLKISAVRISHDSVYLKAKLTNISDENIVIDELSIWYRQHSRSGDETFTKLGEPGQGYKGRYRILPPKKSFVSTKAIDLNDDFFRSGQKYAMSISYGQFSRIEFLADRKSVV